MKFEANLISPFNLLCSDLLVDGAVVCFLDFNNVGYLKELKADLRSSWDPPLGLAQGRQRLISGRELADGDQLQQVPE